MVDHEDESKGEDNLKNPNIEVEDTNKWKHNKKQLTNSDIISNAFLFFVAGYDTTSTTLSFLAYNLAMNSECQDKLCHEVDQILENHVNVILIKIFK